jgi:hypothetical protein
MNQSNFYRQNTFLFSHSPADTAEEQHDDGIITETTFPFFTPFLFDRLVLSANFRANMEGDILLEVQVCSQGEWSRYYKMGLLSNKFKRSFPEQEDALGKVLVDELCLSRPAEGYRFRIKFSGRSQLLNITVSGVRAPFVYDEFYASQLPSGECVVRVEPYSQMELATEEQTRVCSPTSLCMALNALGYYTTPELLMPEVFDQAASIYGNWMFNVAAAGQLGADAFVRRFSSLLELEEWVSASSLLVASIGYQKGELDNAPSEKTAGHLVLIRGWRDGKVLVADPAAPTKETVCRAYDAKQFAQVWLKNKKGAAYVVKKK